MRVVQAAVAAGSTSSFSTIKCVESVPFVNVNVLAFMICTSSRFRSSAPSQTIKRPGFHHSNSDILADEISFVDTVQPVKKIG